MGPMTEGLLLPEYGSERAARSAPVLFGLLALTGAAAFAWGVQGQASGRAWQAYLVNFLFWTGLSAGAVLFVAALNITGARWGRPFKRLAEGLGAFLPVSFLLFWGLYAGREAIFPWIRTPVAGREAWLSPGFLFARNGIGLCLLTLVSVALLSVSAKPPEASPADREPQGNRAASLSGHEDQTGPAWRRPVVLSTAFAILYSLVLTLLAFDFIMSLDPRWVSSLFGAYYFVGSFYTGLAALALVAPFCLRAAARQEGMEVLLPRHFHDLGKLLFGFSLMTGYLFYTQFLVIWYGNIPEEARFLILRFRDPPWSGLAWAVLAAAFAVPFVVLLSRRLKTKPGGLAAVAGLGLAGMWLERFLLVVPSLARGVSFGFMECLVGGGFLGAVGLVATLYMKRFGLLPTGDPLFQAEMTRIRREKEHGQAPDGAER
jgi:hypothetical protein